MYTFDIYMSVSIQITLVFIALNIELNIKQN